LNPARNPQFVAIEKLASLEESFDGGGSVTGRLQGVGHSETRQRILTECCVADRTPMLARRLSANDRGSRDDPQF
jgi:hypothetical protein